MGDAVIVRLPDIGIGSCNCFRMLLVFYLLPCDHTALDSQLIIVRKPWLDGYQVGML